jgi:3-methyl-2-oxobutanoate hydroxymethyltransferase
MMSLSKLQKFKADGVRFSCLTCYDASMAKAMQVAEIDSILIGESLGMTIQGHDSTLPVTIQDIVYHTQAVRRGNQHAFIIADLPFMTYSTLPDAIQSARLVMQAGAQMVKLEGGAWLADTVRVLAQGGIPSCVHMGLTPQSVNVFGGYKVQAKTREAADRLLADCQTVIDAGAAMLLLECVPAQVAKEVQASFAVPVIGIGAGVDCDGQVLVVQDMLGLNFGKPARFVRNFMEGQQGGGNQIVDALTSFHRAVRDREYPAPEHTFQIEL